MKTIVPKNGDQPRAIGRYGSVSEAARDMGTTRQQAKQIIRKARNDHRAARIMARELRQLEEMEAQQ